MRMLTPLLVLLWLVPSGAGVTGLDHRLLDKLGAQVVTEDRRFPQAVKAQVARLSEGEVVLLPGARQLVPGRPIVGATVRVRDLAAARKVLAGRGQEIGSSIFLPPALAHGLWLELRARR
jgi:hypothetical protein